MDVNKAEKLREIKYQLRETCGRCKHSKFPNNQWGTCNLFVYFHKKHQKLLPLSIHQSGYCQEWEQSNEDVHGFAEFQT